MTRVDLRAALDMLPRWTKRNRYAPEGRYALTRSRRMPERLDRVVRKLIDSVDALSYQSTVEMVDVTGENLLVLHQSLRVKALMYFYRRRFAWQDWRRDRLPIFIRFRGWLIIWNGTHRMTLCRLAQRKVRARVLDLEKFIAWRKKHPHGNCRVVSYPPRKKRKK